MSQAKKDYPAAIQALKEYSQINLLIKRRRLEIEHPDRSNREPEIDDHQPLNKIDYQVADQSLKLSNDAQIARLEYVQEAVKASLNLADDVTKEIIREVYLSPSFLNAEGIAQKLHISRKTLYNRRNSFLKQLNSLLCN